MLLTLLSVKLQSQLFKPQQNPHIILYITLAQHIYPLLRQFEHHSILFWSNQTTFYSILLIGWMDFIFTLVLSLFSSTNCSYHLSIFLMLINTCLFFQLMHHHHHFYSLKQFSLRLSNFRLNLFTYFWCLMKVSQCHLFFQDDFFIINLYLITFCLTPW